MRTAIRRIWLRKYKKKLVTAKREKGKGLRIIPALAGIGLALILLWRVDGILRPQMIDLTTAQIQNQVTSIVNEAVEDTLEDSAVYDTLFTMHTDSEGGLSALTANSFALNQLRTSVLECVLTQVGSLDRGDICIPMGNLSGLTFLTGRGPSLPIQILTAAVPTAEFRNVFTSAGINQTLHQVMLDVTVTVKLLVSRGTVECTVTAPVCVAETVLIGQVPETYLNITPSG